MITDNDKKEIIRLYYIEKKTCSEIGKMYNLDHTTILYHLKRIGKKVQKRIKKNIPFISREHTPVRKIGCAPMGKTYRDYVIESMKKQFIRDENGIIVKIIELPTPSNLSVDRRIRGFLTGEFSRLEKDPDIVPPKIIKEEEITQ